MEAAIKPNLFILGAPKCGTTALSEYLRSHPDVYISDPKEPIYFSTDFSDAMRKFHSEKEYLENCFQGVTKETVIGEATATYLVSKEAVKNIYAFNPKAKFIVMLRNPVEQFEALFYGQLKSSRENVRNPEAAWRLIPERRIGKNMPVFCQDSVLVEYDKMCKLGEQLQRVYDLVPRDQVLVIFQEDMKANTQKEYLKVLDFIGVENDGRVDFEIFGERKEPRSIFLNKLLKIPQFVKKKLHITLSTGLLKNIQRKNLQQVYQSQLSEKFRKELIEFFKDDIFLLQKLTGRNLIHWYK